MRRAWVGMALAASVVGASLACAEEPTIWGKPVTKTATATGSATDTTLWTPSTGNAIVLMGCLIGVDRAARVEIESSDVDVIPPIQPGSSGQVSIGYGNFPIWMGAVDATLAYTVSDTSTSSRTSIMCSGYEKPGGF